jgi:hypothetical protein
MTKSLRDIPQHRMRAIFVETQRQEFQAPSGATSSQSAAPDGAFLLCGLRFYKYSAPTALPIRVYPCASVVEKIMPASLIHRLGLVAPARLNIHKA